MTDRKIPVKVDGQVAGEATVHADEHGVYVTSVMNARDGGPLSVPSGSTFSFRFAEEPELSLHDPLAARPPRYRGFLAAREGWRLASEDVIDAAQDADSTGPAGPAAEAAAPEDRGRGEGGPGDAEGLPARGA